RYGHPCRSLQYFQPRRVGTTQHGFQQQQFRPDHHPGEYGAADAAGPQVVLVGDVMNRREFGKLAGTGMPVAALAEAVVSAQQAQAPAKSGVVAPTTSPKVKM